MTTAVFPYATLDGGAAAVLTITGVRLDGASKPLLIRREASAVHLYEGTNSWTRAELEVELTVEPALVRDFETVHGPVSAIAVANCWPTNVRQPLRLARSAVDVGRWSGTLELDRANYRGRVALVSTLTATVNDIRHRPVGFATQWSVFVDEPESLRFKGTLNVKWLNFKAQDAPLPARDFPTSTHVVAFAAGVPELWLNSGFEGLEPLLKDRKDRRGAEKGLHDFQRTGIARSVWMALIADALAAIHQDSSDSEPVDPDWPSTPWQEEILKLVLPEVAPSKSDRELLKLAATEWREHPGAAEFFARAEAVVGDIVKANELLRRFVHNYRAEEVA